MAPCVVWLIAIVASSSPPQGEADSLSPEDSIALSADRLHYEPGTGILTAEGNVAARTQGMTVRADRLVYDQDAHRIAADGNASFTRGMSAALADRIGVDLGTLQIDVDGALFLQKEGVDEETLARASPQGLRTVGKNRLALTGRRIERTGPDSVRVEGLSLTPCDCDPLNPSWRIQAANAHVKAGEYAWLTWPVVYVGPVPIFAFPILQIPLSDRRTGLLVTRPNSTSQSGWSVEQPVFVTLGQSYDLTLTPGYFFGAATRTDEATGIVRPVSALGVRGPRLITEFRYAPKAGLSGAARLGLLYDLLPPRDPVNPDRMVTPGQRGLRGEASVQHRQDFGGGAGLRVDGSFVSDGYYLRDLTTDLFTQGTPYLRSTAAFAWAKDAWFLGAGLVLRQDLRFGFPALVAARGPSGEVWHGPNTLQRLPVVTFAVPEQQILSWLTGSVQVEVTRDAPFLGGTGDEGPDGTFVCLPGEDAATCSGAGSQGNRAFETGEREGRLRLSVRPQLSAPFGAGPVRIMPTLALREEVYWGEVTQRLVHRGYAMASLAAETTLTGKFGTSNDGWVHQLTPRLVARYVPAVFGDAFGAYDAIDNALPVLPVAKSFRAWTPPMGSQLAQSQPIGQGTFELRQRLLRRVGGASQEWLRLDVGQGFDFLEGYPLADTYGRLGLHLGPVNASAGIRFDTRRMQLAQISAQGRLEDARGNALYAQYDLFGADGSDRTRRGIDALVGVPTLDPSIEAQQVLVGGRYAFKFGLGVRYEALVVPQAQKPLAQQTVGLSFAPACDCWQLEFGVQLTPGPKRLDYTFSGNLTIARFGSFGTGG
ncbi:MAG: LPS-assembly protein LptD [Myxococcaceae bacterium]